MKKLLYFALQLLALSVSVLLFTNSSVCYAYSFNDFVSYITETQSDQPAKLGGVISAFLDPSFQNKMRNNSTISNFGVFTGDNFTWILYNRSSTQSNTWKAFTLIGLKNTSGNFDANTSRITFTDLNYMQNNRIVITMDYKYDGGATIEGVGVGTYSNGDYTSIYGALTGMFIGTVNSFPNGSIYYDDTMANPLSFGHMFSEDYTYNGETIQAITTSYSNSVTFIDNLLGYSSGDVVSVVLKDNTTNQNIYNVNFNDLGQYGTISVNTRLIYLNRLYTLTVYEADYELEENIMFLPLGTVITDGSIIFSPSGDFSYNTQDSTNDIINDLNNSSEVSATLNDFADGDLSQKMGFVLVPNTWGDLIIDFCQSIASILITDPSTINPYYIIPKMHSDGYIVLWADDFGLPDGILKTFISSVLVFGTIFVIYRQFMNIIDCFCRGEGAQAMQYVRPDFDIWRM